MKDKGYAYDAEQAEGRWKTLLAAYRRTVDHNNRSGNDRREMQYFQEVEDIVGANPTISPSVVISSSDGLTHRQQQTGAKRKLTDAFADKDAGCSSSDGSASTSGNVTKQPVSKKQKKRAAKKEELVDWLGQYQEQAKQAEEARMQLANKFHTDQMAVMNGLLDVLKQIVNKK